MKLKLFKPQNTALASYMEGYYFLIRDKDDKDVEYLTFPNNYSIITICKDVEWILSDNSVSVKGIKNNQFISDLICHYKKPIRISIQGSINEITFYFKPLGLNAFLKKPLKHYTDTFFSTFLPFEDYQLSMMRILNEPDFDMRITMIEEYWMSKFQGFDHPFLNELVEDTISDPKESVENLAVKYNTSRQTINKLFDLHLCKSPSSFKKVQRFRETLIDNIDKKMTLTEISYEHLFYDQSHLIKDFKSLTGITPKRFFQNTSFHHRDIAYWLFL
ncbi:helix-turn-helix domain-containing protein [Chryseobacterium sp.]|uniref:helix-turn-helix domain-containing protein n=1 Tax=Chryseobacterium sp. TaxID=1871047 RepID=UPI00334084C0